MTADLDPLARYLSGGPCPGWCDLDPCLYTAEPGRSFTTYARAHQSHNLGSEHLRVALYQSEVAASPDSPATDLGVPFVELYAVPGEITLGDPSAARHALLDLAAGILEAADRLAIIERIM